MVDTETRIIRKRNSQTAVEGIDRYRWSAPDAVPTTGGRYVYRLGIRGAGNDRLIRVQDTGGGTTVADLKWTAGGRVTVSLFQERLAMEVVRAIMALAADWEHDRPSRPYGLTG